METIPDGVLRDAVSEGKMEIRERHVNKLTEYQRVLYNIIKEQEVIDPPELYEAYRGRVIDPKTNRTVRNYLQKMERYNLIRAEGEKRGRTYRLVKSSTPHM